MARNKEELENGMLVNEITFTSEEELQELKNALDAHIQQLTPEQKIEHVLFSLQVQMENYLQSSVDLENMRHTGDFLRLYLRELGIQQKKLAEYVGLKPSNLSRLLNGGVINNRLAYIFSSLFQLPDPMIWLQIQQKNKYLEWEQSERAPEEKEYHIKNLLP